MTEKKPEQWKTAQLMQISITRTKAGDAAIQPVYKTEDGKWVRDWITLDKAPDFVWERLGKALGLSESEPREVKSYMCCADRAYASIGTTVLLGLYTEEWNGKDYLKISELHDEDYVPQNTETVETKVEEVETKVKKGKPTDDVPF